MQISRSPQFMEDATEAYAYLRDRDPSVATQLLDQLEATIELLCAFPELGRMRDELRPRVRSFRLRHFPYIIFYRVTAEHIVLLRLLHGVRQQTGKL